MLQTCCAGQSFFSSILFKNKKKPQWLSFHKASLDWFYYFSLRLVSFFFSYPFSCATAAFMETMKRSRIPILPHVAAISKKCVFFSKWLKKGEYRIYFIPRENENKKGADSSSLQESFFIVSFPSRYPPLPLSHQRRFR